MNKLLSLSSLALAMIAASCGGNGKVENGPSFSSDSATVNITFANYEKGQNEYIGAFFYNYDGLDELSPTKISDDGTVTLKLALNGDCGIAMSRGDEDRWSFRVAPGEVTDIVIYGNDSLTSTGKFAALNEAMFNYIPKYSLNMFSPGYIRYDMSGDEYTAAVINKYNELKDSLAADTSLSPELRRVEEASQINSFITLVGNRNFVNRCSYVMNHINDSDFRVDPSAFNNEMTDKNFADAIAAIDADNIAILDGMVEVANSLNGVDWSAKGAQGTLLGTISDYQIAAKEAKENRVDSVRLAALEANSNPFYANAVKNIKAQAQKRFDDAVTLISQVPDGVTGDKLIEAIVEPYKGKVVLIDFWNTWCSPCRASIAWNEPNKSGELSDPDIVWVYIADESSPMPLYTALIPDIKGQHYRLNEEMTKALHKRFDVDGIPYYVLVDRQGNIEGRPDMRDHDVFMSAIKGKLAEK